MKSIVTLTGQNGITLSPVSEKDLLQIATLANNPAIAANLKDVFPSPYHLEDAKLYLTLVEKGVMGLVWGIFSNEQFAGIISILPQTDIYRHSAEIGYWLGAPWQGKGIMTEAVKLVTTFTFNELNIYRIYAGVFEGNEASAKVLAKNGYTLEAIKKKAVIKKGVLLDEHLYVKLNL